MESIEPIGCHDESKLDDSSISNFIEFVGVTGEENLRVVKQEMKAELTSITTENVEQIRKVQVMIDKLFEYITHLKKEFGTVQELYGEARGKMEKLEEESNVGSMRRVDILQK